MVRPVKVSAEEVRTWQAMNGASDAATAQRFKISLAKVRRDRRAGTASESPEPNLIGEDENGKAVIYRGSEAPPRSRRTPGEVAALETLMFRREEGLRAFAELPATQALEARIEAAEEEWEANGASMSKVDGGYEKRRAADALHEEWGARFDAFMATRM